MIQRDFHNPAAIRSFIEQALNEDIGDGQVALRIVLLKKNAPSQVFH